MVSLESPTYGWDTFLTNPCEGGGINGHQRALCTAANVQYGSLLWGLGGKSKACNSKCPAGWITLSKNSHITGPKSGCKSGRYAPLCAQSVIIQPNSRCCPATPASHLLSGGLSQHPGFDHVFNFGLVGGAGGFTDFGGMSRRQASKANHKRGEHGTYLDVICQLDVIDRSQIPIDVPAGLDVVSLGGGISFASMHAQTNTIRIAIPTPIPRLVMSHTTTTTYSTLPRTCDGIRYPQACAHYSSVITQQGGSASLLTCSNRFVSNDNWPTAYTWSS
jgi:hypothetical protein